MTFTLIPDAYCVLRLAKGSYKQVKVYSREGVHVGPYCGYGSNFLRLTKSGTSNARISWDELDGVEWKADNTGRLFLK